MPRQMAFPMHRDVGASGVKGVRPQCGQLKPSDSMANFKNTILKIFYSVYTRIPQSVIGRFLCYGRSGSLKTDDAIPASTQRCKMRQL